MVLAENHQVFEDLLWDVLDYGEKRGSRAGKTYSIFAPDPLRYDLRNDRVALITSKTVPWKMALREFMWMLSGSTNTQDLRKSSPVMADIWDNWADPVTHDVGPTYGAQYRDAGALTFDQDAGNGVDQLAQVIDRLEKTPDTRRAIISLWSAAELDQMKLEPCMVIFQFSRRGPGMRELHLHVYQRSADMMLGVPFDLFQASFLVHAVARELRVNRDQDVVGASLTWSAGDVHLYENQVEPAKLQLQQYAHAKEIRATISIDSHPSLSLLNGSLDPGNVKVLNYNPEPPIAGGKIAV